MEKKVISVHAVTIHIYTIIIAVLVLIMLAMGAKYIHLKLATDRFMQATIWHNMQNQQNSNVSDYGALVAATITNMSLLSTPDVLQKYVDASSKAVHRDIVVLDTHTKILADTIPTNRGSAYSYDKEQAIAMTLKDGIMRDFVETSPDYPQGLVEVVVPIKDASSNILGAILVSGTTIAK